MKAFKVTGSVPMGRIVQPFSVEVAAENEAAAREKTVSSIGSKHKVKRRFITIDKIDAMKTDEITNHVVLHLAGGHK